MSASKLQEPTISIKHKLSALWASVMFCFIYGDYFELYTPGKMESLLSGDNILNDPTKLFIAAVVLAIPAVMIGLTVLLRAPISRILNIIFGTFFTLVMVLIGVTSITPWYSFYVLYAFIESILTATIVIYAWKWPRE